MPRRARWLVPEVLQTSAMDCGPAALHSVLAGFGISSNYARLREACQTDVDGTSISALEDAATQLGLSAQQTIVPFDHVALDEAQLLPAIVTFWSPGKLVHFAVAWRRAGPLVQVMDPSAGRRWPTVRRFREHLYVHQMEIDAAEWLAWASSDDFMRPLHRRLARLGFNRADRTSLPNSCVTCTDSLAGLDAAVRMASDLMIGHGLRQTAARLLVRSLVTRAADNHQLFEQTIPAHYWSCKPSNGDFSAGRVILRGALIVSISPPEQSGAPSGVPLPASSTDRAPLSAALEDQLSRRSPGYIHLLTVNGATAPAALLLTVVLAAGTVPLEALILRGLMTATEGAATERGTLVGVAAAALALALVLEGSITRAALRLGRLLELRLRAAMAYAIPRLGDHYFQSRLVSDMAERCHSLHAVRGVPWLTTRAVNAGAELTATVACLAWLDPSSAAVAGPAGLLVVALPMLLSPWFVERELRFRSHAAALTRVVLDASLGPMPIRAHHAGRAIRRQHQALLTEWGRSGLRVHDLERRLSMLQSLVGFGAAFWILWSCIGKPAGAVPLLIAYWALRIPLVGRELATVMAQFSVRRNVLLRLLEPLDEASQPVPTPAASGQLDATGRLPRGASLRLEGVSVRVGAHTLLENVTLSVCAGEHIAIVGPSGAGKSSLLGLLLGWHPAASGAMHVDGVEGDHSCLARLRAGTAWVDPGIQLWNRSLRDNLHYGLTPDERAAAPLDTAPGIASIAHRLPDGYDTRLGEGGGLLSGGEGQRVRLARALLKKQTRLAILDEPFRGLDRTTRGELLSQARCHWNGTTLLCVTHDVCETHTFDRVLVIDGGRLVEDGPPAELARAPGSRYARLLAAETQLREETWRDPRWRRLWLEGGHLEPR
jgi:ABC-type bacteriocin/lantibiotic exporter with double-glycine peptidase domain